MEIRVHGMTDRGRVRAANEDAFYIAPGGVVLAVADGLGGLPGGAETSARVVQLLADHFKAAPDGAAIDFAPIMRHIDEVVADEGLTAHPATGSGSTLTVAQLIEESLFVAHVGDSAAYHLRCGELTKLTIDHTMEEELIRRHGESARENMPLEYPHMLTRCIGQGSELLIDQTRYALRPGDRVLLCTDGLNKMLTTETIRRELAREATPEAICQRLTELANEARGADNITVITAFIESL